MSTVFKVSHSEAESFLACRRKHFYGYIKDGGLKPVTVGTSLSRGSFLHAVLEVYYNFVLAAGETNKEQRAAHKDAVAEALAYYTKRTTAGAEDFFNDTPPSRKRSVHEALFEFYFPNESIVRAGWTVQAVELSVSLELDLGDGTTYQYPFVVDLIAVDPKGKTVVIDHKFAYDFYSGDDVDMLSQLPKYLAALRAGEFPADYAAYNLIRNSSKKNAQYEDVVRFLPVKPTAAQVQQVFGEQVAVATTILGLKEVEEAEADQLAFRSASTITCNMCDFSNLCRSERVGSDTSIPLAMDFTRRTDKPFEADITIK